MVSFRNILVHDYAKIDEKIIVDILKNHLAPGGIDLQNYRLTI